MKSCGFSEATAIGKRWRRRTGGGVDHRRRKHKNDCREVIVPSEHYSSLSFRVDLKPLSASSLRQKISKTVPSSNLHLAGLLAPLFRRLMPKSTSLGLMFAFRRILRRRLEEENGGS